VDADCDDSNACTVDRCSTGVCKHSAIPGCVPCVDGQQCPPLQVVFVMDTSGSMVDQAAAICTQTAAVIQSLAGQGITVRPAFLGITENPGGDFSCLTDNVVRLLGAAVPGDGASCPFPVGPSARESWGPATAIVAQRFAWSPGAIRVVIPVGDESPCNGDGPLGCNDPGDDRASIQNAIAVANANRVIVSPIIGSSANDCTSRLASDLAAGTGGVKVESARPSTDITAALIRVLKDACSLAEQCDDLNPCTESDSCTGGVCTGIPLPDCMPCTEDSACEDENACTVDICEAGVCIHNTLPDCVPCDGAEDCDDANPCTREICEAGVCDHEPSFDPDLECCNPKTGALTAIDDDNDCTSDQCNAATGQVSHAPLPIGTACDDGNECTVQDRCRAMALCLGTDIESIRCVSDADCFDAVCDPATNRCDCGDRPTLRLVAVPDPESPTECFLEGRPIEIRVEVGFSRALLGGGQFLIQFDPDVLAFVSAEPGSAADPNSPFSMEFFESVDSVNGRVFHAVGIPFGRPGQRGPAVISVLRFLTLDACVEDRLCFVNRNPQLTLLTDAQGREVPFVPVCTEELRIDDGPPVLTCPPSLAINADAGEVTAVVQWDPPRAQDDCDAVSLTCSARHELGVNLNPLLTRGGTFPQGRADFECASVDSCGAESECSWFVDVEEANGVEITLQLSPTMIRGPLNRCIEFEFFANCVEGASVVRQTVQFGLPFNLPGRSSNVRLKVPPGRYECVTARDPLHTVRAVADIQQVGTKYVAAFQGDPFFGGNWLIGGNLDGNRVIDIIDFGVFLGQYLSRRDGHTGCERADRDADLNGDGIVDQLDWSFIQRNYLRADKDSCCPGDGVAAADMAITQITVAELDELGLGDLRVADLNGDGVLDEADMAAFLAGARPLPPKTKGNIVQPR
jgi:hypothetical protein